MDPNEEEPGEEQPKSGIDNINDAARNIRRAKNDVQNVQKGARFAQKGAQAIRAGAQAIRAGTSAVQGASAAAGMMGGAEGGAAAAGGAAAGAAAAGAAEGAGAAAAGAAAGAAAEGAAVAAAGAGAAAGGTVELWGPIVAIIAAILLLVFVFIVIFAVIFQPPPTKGGTLDCGDIGGTCSADTTCASVAPASVPDTTGATCNDPTDPTKTTCCVPQKNCADIGGICSPDTTCADVPKSQPDTNTTCNDPANPTKTTCCVPKSTLNCDPAAAAQSLKDTLNIVVKGAANNNQISTICKIYAIAIKSPTYKSLLTCGGGQLTIGLDSSSGISRTSASTIVLRGFFGSYGFSPQTYLLLHESGHVIDNRNCSRVSQKFTTSYPNLVSVDGNACYDMGYIKSYPLRLGTHSCNDPNTITGISARNESFAESIADYITYRYFTNPTGFDCSISLKGSYQSSCNSTYNWVQSNIFGGTEF